MFALTRIRVIIALKVLYMSRTVPHKETLTVEFKSDFIARADVVNLLHVNEDKAYNLLKMLTIQGVLTMVNKGRYAKYKLNSK